MKVFFVKKTIRDILSSRRQLLPIIILLFLGTSLTIGISIAKSNLIESEKIMKKQANMADYYFSLSSDCSEEELRALGESQYIDDYTVRMSVEGNIKNLSNKNVRLFSYDTTINNPIIYEGNFNLGNKNVIINYGFYRLNSDLNIGKELEVGIGKKVYMTNLTGTYNTTEYLQGVDSEFFRSDYAAMIISPELFQQISAENAITYELLVKKNAQVSDQMFIQDIDNIIGKNKILKCLLYPELHSQETFYEVLINKVFTQYKNVFISFLLFIIMVITILTMTRLIKDQNKTIGLLKMMGYDNFQIELQYFFIGFIVSIISVIFGGVVGWNISKTITNYYIKIFDIRNAIFVNKICDFLPILIICILIVSISMSICIYNMGKIEPIILVKNSIITRIHYDNIFSKTKISANLTASKKNAIRVLGGQKKRIFASVLITSVSSILLILLLVFIDQDSYMEKQDQQFRQYQGSLIISKPENKFLIYEIVKKINLKDYQLNYEDEITLLNDSDTKVQIIVTANEMCGNYIGGKKLHTGIAVSDSCASALGLKIGDNISVEIQKREYNFKVESIFKYYSYCMVIPVEILPDANLLKYNKVHFKMYNDQQKNTIKKYVENQELFTAVSFQDDFWKQVEESNKISYIIYYGCIGIVIFLNYFIIQVIINSIYYENYQDMVVMKFLGIPLKDISSIIYLDLFIMYICLLLVTTFVIPWLLPYVHNMFGFSIYYNFNISWKNILYTQIIIGGMFILLFLKYLKKISDL